MRKHHGLRVWQASMDLVVKTYEVTENFPDSEKFGLISQMRRASVSVPSNIAEGAARGSRPDFVRFLHIARGSLSELETKFRLVERLNFQCETSVILGQIDQILSLLSGLINQQRAGRE